MINIKIPKISILNPSWLPQQLSIAGIPCGRKLINILVIVQLHIIRACPCRYRGRFRAASRTAAASLAGAAAGAGTTTGTTKTSSAKASTTAAAAETTAAGPAAATAAADAGTGAAVAKEQIIDDVPEGGRLICTAAAAETIGKNRGNARKYYCNRANN